MRPPIKQLLVATLLVVLTALPTSARQEFQSGTGGGATPSFTSVTSGTNSTAAMVVGTGASLTTGGSGTITATTAAALAADPANCSAGQAAGGVTAAGASESCVAIPTAASPTQRADLSVHNGSASTFMRSDAAPQIAENIAPLWTGAHTFTIGGITLSGSPFDASGSSSFRIHTNTSLVTAAAGDIGIDPDGGGAAWADGYLGFYTSERMRAIAIQFDRIPLDGTGSWFPYMDDTDGTVQPMKIDMAGADGNVLVKDAATGGIKVGGAPVTSFTALTDRAAASQLPDNDTVRGLPAVSGGPGVGVEQYYGAPRPNVYLSFFDDFSACASANSDGGATSPALSADHAWGGKRDAAGSWATYGANTATGSTTGTGTCRFRLGTAAAPTWLTATAMINDFVPTGGEEYAFRIFFPTLATASIDYWWMIGISDEQSATPDKAAQDTIAFLYDRSTSLNWQLVTCSNGTGTEPDTTGCTYTDLGASAVVNEDTWYTLRAVPSADGTSIQANINGSDIGSPVTADVPDGRAAGLFIGGKKTADSAATNIDAYVDYFLVSRDSR